MKIWSRFGPRKYGPNAPFSPFLVNFTRPKHVLKRWLGTPNFDITYLHLFSKNAIRHFFDKGNRLEPNLD